MTWLYNRCMVSIRPQIIYYVMSVHITTKCKIIFNVIHIFFNLSVHELNTY